MSSTSRMRTLAPKALAIALSLLSYHTYAAPSCSSFLNSSQAVNNNPLTTLQLEIDQAQSLEEANKLTFEMATLGNAIFDNIIDGIAAMNSQPAVDPIVVNQQKAYLQSLINALQEAFQISAEDMNSALNNRLEIESAEFERIRKAEQEKMTIGFGKDELAQDFHADKPSTKEPIGFVTGIVSAKEEKLSNPYRNVLTAQVNLKSVKKNKTPSEKIKNPIGFVPPKESRSTDSTKPLDQVGFVQSSNKEKSFSQDDIVQIFLDLEIGEFSISENKSTIGF